MNPVSSQAFVTRLLVGHNECWTAVLVRPWSAAVGAFAAGTSRFASAPLSQGKRGCDGMGLCPWGPSGPLHFIHDLPAVARYRKTVDSLRLYTTSSGFATWPSPPSQGWACGPALMKKLGPVKGSGNGAKAACSPWAPITSASPNSKARMGHASTQIGCLPVVTRSAQPSHFTLHPRTSSM